MRKLDPVTLPSLAHAGAQHLVLAVRDKKRLDDPNYEFDALKALMLRGTYEACDDPV